MSKTSSAGKLRSALMALLDSADYSGIAGLWKRRHGVLRMLISMTYDKGDLRSWRAMEAIGRITSVMHTDRARAVIQRLLWMMREESGSNAWSAGEIIGEILAANPGPFEDIVPVIVSFHDEPLLRPGVLWAMARVAAVRPDLVESFVHVPLAYLESGETPVRGLALLALSGIKKDEVKAGIKGMFADGAVFTYYDGHLLVEKTLGELAAGVLAPERPDR
jgi:hypothetical protein